MQGLLALAVRIQPLPNPFGCSLSGKDRVPSRPFGRKKGSGEVVSPQVSVWLCCMGKLTLDSPNETRLSAGGTELGLVA